MTTLDASLRLRLVDEVSATARAAGAALDQMGTQASAGARRGASAFEEMKLAELGASREAARLRTELRRLEASGEGTEGEMRELSLAMVRARQEASRLAAESRRLSTAQASTGGTVAASSTAVSGGMLRVSQASRVAGRGMAENINLVSELALGFGGLSPKTQQLGLAFATAGNNAFALAGAMGVPGVIAGTVVGVLPAVIDLFRQSGEEAESMAAANHTAERSFLDLVDAIQQARQAQEREEQLSRGQASVEEQRDALRAAESSLASARSRNNEALNETLASALGPGASAPSDRAGLEAAARAVIEGGGLTGNVIDDADSVNAAIRAQGGAINGRAGQTVGSGFLVRQLVQALAQQDTSAAEDEVTTLRARLTDAEAQANSEAAAQRVQDAPRRSQEALADLLAASGASQEIQSRAREQIQRGHVDSSVRGALGDDVVDRALAEVQRGRAATVAAAQARVDARRLDVGEDGVVNFGAPAAAAETPEPTIERVRRRSRRRVAARTEEREQASTETADFREAVAGLQDLTRRSESRTQIVVRIEDNRLASAEVVPISGDAPDVSTAGADLFGGQQ